MKRINLTIVAPAAIAVIAALAASLPHFIVKTPQGIYPIHIMQTNPRRTKVQNGATEREYDYLKDQAVGFKSNFVNPFKIYSIIQYTALTAMAAQAAINKETKERFIPKFTIAAVAVALQIVCMTGPPIVHAMERKSSLNSHSHKEPPGQIETNIGPGLILAAFTPLAALVQTTFLSKEFAPLNEKGVGNIKQF